jgi:luciferase family oxidoreductase group 1
LKLTENALSNEKPVRYSAFDLSSILKGSTAAQSFRNSLALAQHVEKLGYYRYWVAEHHNIAGIAASATSVLIGYLAAGTQHIRVGSGGVMLPNHAPLVIAEQFGTLESMYPGRIDLGLGRAPGGDSRTAMALWRGVESGANRFPMDVQELQSYFRHNPNPQSVHAIPGDGLNVPIYLLGSSDFSARLAADLGLPFAFASHFAPDALNVALGLYRQNFRPSAALAKPYVIVGVNAIAAETDAEGRRLFTSVQQRFMQMFRNHREELPPPVDSMDAIWTPQEAAGVNHKLRYSAVGSSETVRAALKSLIDSTMPDELMIGGDIFDQPTRLRSFEIVAEVMKGINGGLQLQ